MGSTRIARHIRAPRAAVYRALLDPDAIAQWKVPTGKTTAHTDTYHGPPITLADAGDDTDVVGVHEGLPSGVSTADNETGWRMALDKLASLVEAM